MVVPLLHKRERLERAAVRFQAVVEVKDESGESESKRFEQVTAKLQSKGLMENEHGEPAIDGAVAIFPVCIDENPAVKQEFSGAVLEAQLKVLAANFGAVMVVLADDQRHTKRIQFPSEAEHSLQLTYNKMGQEWLNANKEVLQRVVGDKLLVLGNKPAGSIVMHWNDFLRTENSVSTLDVKEKAYQLTPLDMRQQIDALLNPDTRMQALAAGKTLPLIPVELTAKYLEMVDKSVEQSRERIKKKARMAKIAEPVSDKRQDQCSRKHIDEEARFLLELNNRIVSEFESQEKFDDGTVIVHDSITPAMGFVIRYLVQRRAQGQQKEQTAKKQNPHRMQHTKFQIRKKVIRRASPSHRAGSSPQVPPRARSFHVAGLECSEAPSYARSIFSTSSRNRSFSSSLPRASDPINVPQPYKQQSTAAGTVASNKPPSPVKLVAKQTLRGIDAVLEDLSDEEGEDFLMQIVENVLSRMGDSNTQRVKRVRRNLQHERAYDEQPQMDEIMISDDDDYMDMENRLPSPIMVGGAPS